LIRCPQELRGPDRLLRDVFAWPDVENKHVMPVRSLAPAAIHHGDAIGADAQMHALATEASAAIIIHPPLKDVDRAFCEGGELREPDSYTRRNARIVEESEMLIATPAGPEASARGAGIWRSVRLAIRQGKPVCIVRPTVR
jgi:hypothetical protein